jgi:hypothetical protein
MLQAMQDRDINTLRNFYSLSPVFRGIGSSADEVWDAESFLPVFEVQLEEMPTFEFSLGHVEAFEMGEFAWGTALMDLGLADGTSFSMRISMVFVIEDGLWRCVHHHASTPVSNEETLGVALTTTLTDLVDALAGDTLVPIGGAEGTATLMFTDIEDSTVLAQEMGDQMWSETIEDHDRFVVATVEEHAGTVIKTLGDGALISFGGARAALRCAGDLQAGFAERPFAVRIGIHAGEAVRL